MRRGKNLSPNSDRDDTLWPFENKKKQKQIGPWTFANCCEMVICQDVVNDMRQFIFLKAICGWCYLTEMIFR